MFDSFLDLIRWQISAIDLNSINEYPLLLMISYSISFILSFVIALLAIAFYTLIERKFLGYYQLRKGPNKISLIGIPQPFADALKLFTKEISSPSVANASSYIVAPVIGLILALLLWILYPHIQVSIFMLYGALYFLCVSRINVYTTFIAGWASNSKYALLGALRSIAQTISYEVSISLILLSILLIQRSIDFQVINISLSSWIILMAIPICFIWFITNLAETNRTPFDFAEGESELVSGFNVEYRAGSFALIFIAEYINILMIRLITVVIFSRNLLLLDLFLVVKTILLATLFVWIRATLPRIRYDNLIYLAWKLFLPVRLAALIIIVPLILAL